MKKWIGTILLCLLVIIVSVSYADPAEWQGTWVQGSRATASWTAYDGADYYFVDVEVRSDDGSTIVGTMQTGTDTLRIDLQQEIHQIVGNTNYDSVKVSFTVKAAKEGTNGKEILFIGMQSATIDYNLRLVIVLDTPEAWGSKKGFVTVTPVEGADYYVVDAVVYSRATGQQVIMTSATLYPDENGEVTYDFGEYLRDHISEYINPNYAQGITYYVQAFSNDSDLYKPSKRWGYGAPYYGDATLANPQGTVSKSGVVTLEPVEHADYYYVWVSRYDNYSNYLLGGAYIYPDENGILTYDFSGFLKEQYRQYSNQNVSLQCMFEATAYSNDAENYNPSYLTTQLGYATFSKTDISVEAITLSPGKPILHVGNLLNIGKTIEPEDGYYETIQWRSSNSDILQVDNVGKITGIKPGEATITASIGNISASVPVTVYTIASTIEDTADQNEVIDTAGTIIDEIGNNDNPDLPNVDIGDQTVQEVQESIHTGIDRGDTFHSDIVYQKKDWNQFEQYKADIEKVVTGGIFAGGYDIGIDVYHQDSHNNKHHIANITELNSEIGFTVTGNTIPDPAPGTVRSFYIVRIHNGVAESIPVTVTDGNKYKSKSKWFSDFILMYKDSSEEKTEDKKGDKSEEKSDGQTSGKTAEKTEDKTAVNSDEKKNDKTDEKTTEKAADKTEDKKDNKTDNKTDAEPTEKKEDKTDEKADDKTADKPEEEKKDEKPTGEKDEDKTNEKQDDGVTAFVKRCYKIILNRDADAEGLQGWTEALKSKVATAAQIIDGFVRSPEFVLRSLGNEVAVEILYRTMLDREADPEGKAGWTDALNKGYTLQHIINGFCGSVEFNGLCDKFGIEAGNVSVNPVNQVRSNIEAFVKRCYQLILSRDADEEGLKGWSDALEQRVASAAQIIDGFIRSPEFINRALGNDAAVDILYRTMLDREADPEGRAGWVDALGQGYTLQHIINGFCGSVEFDTICNSYGIVAGNVAVSGALLKREAITPEDEEAAPVVVGEYRSEFINEEKIRAFVEHCYVSVFGREGDAEGIENYTALILDGKKTPKKVAYEFIFSPEFQNQIPGNEEFIRILYRLYFDREADAEGLAGWVAMLEGGTSLEDIVNGFAGSDEFKTIVNAMKQ